jgi:hypothetical protein
MIINQKVVEDAIPLLISENDLILTQPIIVSKDFTQALPLAGLTQVFTN